MYAVVLHIVKKTKYAIIMVFLGLLVALILLDRENGYKEKSLVVEIPAEGALKDPSEDKQGLAYTNLVKLRQIGPRSPENYVSMARTIDDPQYLKRVQKSNAIKQYLDAPRVCA